MQNYTYQYLYAEESSHRSTKIKIEPWAAASVAAVFEELGLKYPKTEAGAPSFTKQYLNTHAHPIAQMIVKLREFDKADSTFIDTIIKHSHKGRINCEFHQLRSDDGGTVTGRFSSSNPNLQQIPARDPEIKKLSTVSRVRFWVVAGAVLVSSAGT